MDVLNVNWSINGKQSQMYIFSMNSFVVMAPIEKSWLSVTIYGGRLSVFNTKIHVLIMLMARVDIRELELFTENGAVYIGAKHKMTQSYWGARGIRFGWLKVNVCPQKIITLEQQEACAISC